METAKSSRIESIAILHGPAGEDSHLLWVVYLVWMAVILLLYPVCKKYMAYKASNKNGG